MESLDELKKRLTQNNNDRHSKDGFSVPDGYFEQSKQSMLDQFQENQPRRIRSMYNYITVAASVCVLVACVFLLRNQTDGPDNASFAMNDVTLEESIDFILDQELDDITTEDMLELANIDEILEDIETEINN